MIRSTKSVLAALATFLCCIILVSAQTCQVSVEQNQLSSWNNNGVAQSLVQVSIINTGSAAVTDVTLATSSAFENSWDIQVSNGLLTLPSYKKGIDVGQQHSWGYIIKSSGPASLTVRTVSCGGKESNPVRPLPTTAPVSTAAPVPPIAPTTRPRPTAAPSTPRPTAAPSTPRPTAAPSTPRPTAAPSTPRPTAAPSTPRPTAAPSTPRPTAAPSTPRPTAAPSTPRPTSAPTQRPPTAPTERPVTPPTTGGRICPAGQVWSPTPGTTWQWQLTGTIDQSFDVQMYDIDLFDATPALISQLHQKGRVVICYFSTQYEDWRPDANLFTSAVLGSNLDDWPGERYVDIRSPVLRSIMTARLDLAVSKGCDGVEPDNVDSYANSNGLGLTAANQIDYNKFIAQQAHARGLSVGLKNDLDQVGSLVSSFDWALNEQCAEYGECDMLKPFVTAGKAVFGVEYTGSASSFCPNMITNKFSWLLKDLSLGAAVKSSCCTLASGGCQKAAYTCKAYSSKRDELEHVEEIVAEVVEAVEVSEPLPVEELASAGAATALPVVLVALAAISALLF